MHEAEEVAGLSAFPNPASAQVSVLMAGATSAELVSMAGQIIPVAIRNGKFDVSAIALGVCVNDLQRQAVLSQETRGVALIIGGGKAHCARS